MDISKPTAPEGASSFPPKPEADLTDAEWLEQRKRAAQRLGARDALLRARRALHRAGPDALAGVLDGMIGAPMEQILAELDAIADRAVEAGEHS